MRQVLDVSIFRERRTVQKSMGLQGQRSWRISLHRCKTLPLQPKYQNINSLRIAPGAKDENVNKDDLKSLLVTLHRDTDCAPSIWFQATAEGHVSRYLILFCLSLSLSPSFAGIRWSTVYWPLVGTTSSTTDRWPCPHKALSSVVLLAISCTSSLRASMTGFHALQYRCCATKGQLKRQKAQPRAQLGTGNAPDLLHGGRALLRFLGGAAPWLGLSSATLHRTIVGFAFPLLPEENCNSLTRQTRTCNPWLHRQ